MKRTLLLAAGAAFVVSACSDLQAPPASNDDVPLTAALAKKGGGGANVLDELNAGLVGQDYEISSAEIYTDPASGEMGTVIFARNVGNKQTSSDFVPGDPRRGGLNNITYLTDGVDGATASGLTEPQTTAAIESAMSTWDGVQCSTIPLTNLGTAPFDVGVVQALDGFGGILSVFGDITHGGWLPQAFFEGLRPGGGTSILGVTFTFSFTSGPGTPLTDIDGNGKADVAFREIYYNDAFSWAADGSSNFDVETVALHEAGHGLSQGHFGKIFGTVANQTIHFAPRAVMNASYSGIQREIGKTDNGGHCSNWGSWPNN